MRTGQNQTHGGWYYYVLMVVAMLFWGVAWTVGKVAAEHSNAEVAAFWRYAISFLTIIPVVIWMKIPMKSDRVGYGYMAASGLLTSLFNYLFFAGLSHGQAGYGGTMVTALSPIFTYLISIAFLRLQSPSSRGLPLWSVSLGLCYSFVSLLTGLHF